MPLNDPLATGTLINNRYRIVKLLGQGGFGAVYRAWDINLNGAVAIKENFDTSPTAQSQFAHEATILFNLRHPNLPRVTDHFSLPGQGQYLVMDYIEGEDLEEKRQKAGGFLSEAQVLPWIIQVLDALEYLHNEEPQVIHRDIKPANIKISPKGRAILVDFGIAKIIGSQLKTTVGARAVTPGYSPLEQYSQGKTDARSDIYALGATLYSALTGYEPPESIQRTMGIPLPSPRTYNPAISQQTDQAILRAMEMTMDKRFQSASEFKEALLKPAAPIVQPLPNVASWQVNSLAPTLVVSPAMPTIVAAPPTPQHIYHPAPSRRIPWLWVGLVLLLIVGAGIGGWIILYPDSNPFGIGFSPKPTSTHLSITRTPKATLTVVAIKTENPTNTPIVEVTPSETVIPTPTIVPTPTNTSPPPPPIIGGADKIAFLNANDIWIANLDGSDLLRLTNDGAIKSNLQWTPDGQSVVFITGKCAQMVNINTGQIDILVCFKYASFFEAFEISPDGTRLAVSVDRQLFVVAYDITSLSKVGSAKGLVPMAECSQLAPYTQYAVKTAHWSNDGKHLAVVFLAVEAGKAPDQVTLLDISRCEYPTPIDYFPATRYKMSGYKDNPVLQNFGWDGKDLFALIGMIRNGGFGDLWIYNHSLYKANQYTPIGKSCCYRDPQFSPDGSYLVFAYQDMRLGEVSIIKLYYIQLDTLGSGIEYTPLLLPDDFFADRTEKPHPVLRPAK